METFLREVEARLAAMDEAQRSIEMQRLVQLFKAVSYMRDVFKLKGGSRMVAWVGEQVIAKVPAERVAEKMKQKAETLGLTYVLDLIKAAAA